jgi:hypothetical protein
MKRLSFLIFTFALVFTIFFLTPVILGQPFLPYPLMKISDVFDLFTPLVLIPLYWLLFVAVTDEPPSLKETTAFIILAAFWVEGHGMHLGANSIGHWLGGMEATDFYQVDYFYDEVLGHYLWHIGVIGLSGLILLRQWRNPFVAGKVSAWLPVIAGLIHGFTFFLIVDEGQTVPMSFPFAIVVMLFGLIWVRKKFKKQPLLLFFFVAYLVATLFLTGWGIYWGGWPEFSKIGII